MVIKVVFELGKKEPAVLNKIIKMNPRNSLGSLKIRCKYQINSHTEKTFTCSTVQKCCGSECCDDENIDTYPMLAAGVILLVMIGLICWYIARGRSKVTVSDNQQRVTNMVASVRPSMDCAVEMNAGGDGNHGCTNTRELPANIPYVYSVFATPTWGPENLKTGSDDQQPLLDDSIWDEKPPSLTSPSSLI